MGRGFEAKIIKKYIEWEKKSLIIGFVLSVVVAFASIGAGTTLKILVDDVLIANQPQYLLGIECSFLALVFVQSVFSILKGKVYLNAAGRTAVMLKGEMVNRLLKSDYKLFSQMKRGDILTKFSYDVDGLENFFSNGISELLGSIVTIVITMGFMFFLDWKLTLITCPIFPLMMFVFHFLQKKVEQKASVLQKERKIQSSLLNQVLDAIILIKTFHVENAYHDKMNLSVEKMRKSTIELNMLYIVMGLASWSMIMVPYQAIMYYIAGRCYFQNGEPSIGLMLAFANYANSLIGPFLSIQQCQQNWTYAKLCIKSIDEILELKEECTEEENCSDQKLRNGLENDKNNKHQIECKNITFRYGKEKILSDLKVIFVENSINVILGKSGRGKSTLLKVLLRLYPVENGDILYKGESIYEIAMDEYRKEIAYVPQDVSLMGDSIYECIKLVSADITEEEIYSVLDLLEMKEEVKALPEGIYSSLGERGASLSGGQKQRILIAMALLKNAKIFLFDEPTSALDKANTEVFKKILQYLKKNRIIIIATHDETLLELSNNTILL